MLRRNNSIIEQIELWGKGILSELAAAIMAFSEVLFVSIVWGIGILLTVAWWVAIIICVIWIWSLI